MKVSTISNGGNNKDKNVTRMNKNEKNVKKEVKVFVTPTSQEVKDYCKERDNTIDSEKFVDFYSSKGWMVGKNKMTDWKSCVRTWEKSDNNNPRQSKKPKEGNFDDDDKYAAIYDD